MGDKQEIVLGCHDSVMVHEMPRGFLVWRVPGLVWLLGKTFQRNDGKVGIGNIIRSCTMHGG